MDGFHDYDWRGDDPPAGLLRIFLIAFVGGAAVIGLVLVGAQLWGA